MKTKDQILLEEAYKEVYQEGVLASIGHSVLDIAGLIPGAGEFADITNAVWYCLEGEYLHAALSLISCIPVIGDVIGKGTKVGMFLSKVGPAINSLRILIQSNKFLINTLFSLASKDQKLAPYVKMMKQALDAFAGTR